MLHVPADTHDSLFMRSSFMWEVMLLAVGSGSNNVTLPPWRLVLLPVPASWEKPCVVLACPLSPWLAGATGVLYLHVQHLCNAGTEVVFDA